MKANSHHHPTRFTKTHGKVWLNKNIVESEKTDEETGETRPWFVYDQIEITHKNKAEIMLQAKDDGQYLQGFKDSHEHYFKNFKEELNQ